MQSDMPKSDPPVPDEKRSSERVEVSWAVDCDADDTFLFAYITNISEMGIFVRTEEPLTAGTIVKLRFAPRGMGEPFVMLGRVQWINRVSAFGENLNPGMGLMFIDLQREERERLVAAIRTIAYLRGSPSDHGSN
jgi:type IV pilus assembly protein PilZ